MNVLFYSRIPTVYIWSHAHINLPYFKLSLNHTLKQLIDSPDVFQVDGILKEVIGDGIVKIGDINDIMEKLGGTIHGRVVIVIIIMIIMMQVPIHNLSSGYLCLVP